MKKYTLDTIAFYNQNIDTYIKSGAVVLKSKINNFIKLLSGNNILDVACGPGHDTDFFTKKGFSCLGIDLSQKMIDYARKNYEGKFKLMNFLNLKFKNNYFDGIWCSSALTHVKKEDLNKVLLNFSSILKTKGILAIIVAAQQKRRKRKNDARIFTMFYKKELEKSLRKNRFKVISSNEFSYGNMKWIYIISKNNKLNKKRSR